MVQSKKQNTDNYVMDVVKRTCVEDNCNVEHCTGKTSYMCSKSNWMQI